MIETTPAVTPRAIVCSAPFDGRRLGRALERHRRALPHHEDRDEHRQRQEQPDRGAREIDVEVAERLQAISGEAADDGDGRRHAGGRGHELQEARW